MQFAKRFIFGVAASATLLGTAACNDDSQPLLATADVPSEQAGAQPAIERLATLVATSLRDPSVRAQFRAATAGSPVREGKLLLSSYLHGQGQGLLKAMARAGNVSEAEILGLIGQTGALEIYLPIEAHRGAWKGDANLIVAAQLVEEEDPFGVDLNGNRVALSLKSEPTTPTVSIVPAEGFDEQGNAYSVRNVGGVRTNKTGGARLGMNPDGTYTGLWVNEIHTSQEYEPWTKGDPEFEMTLENATTRAKMVCAEEDATVEPYRFNMNSTNYYNDFLIADNTELPQGQPFIIYLYEDDDTRCVVKDDKDYPKLAADALSNAYSAYKSLKSKEWQDGQWIIKLSAAYTAFKSFMTGNDEFAGASAGLSDIGTTPAQFQLKDQNMNNIGWITLQWKSDFAQ